MMIQHGRHACYKRDRKGYLPAHVACSRHCSPEKLRLLLAVYQGALYETTNDGATLLSLATKTATRSHPNYALLNELRVQLDAAARSSMATSYGLAPAVSTSSETSSPLRSRLDSNDSARSDDAMVTSRKRKAPEETYEVYDDPAGLLLHFSRNGSPGSPTQIAKV
jgi:hypothetical protein